MLVLGLGLLSCEAAAGLLLGTNHGRLVASIAGIAVVGTCCFALPRLTVLVLAATWGVLHSMLLDYKLLKIGPVQLTLSRGLGIIILLFFGLAILAMVASKELPPLPVPLKALLIFLCLVVVGGLANHPTGAGLSDAVRVTSGVVLAVVAFAVFDTPARFERLLTVATYAGVAIAMITIVQFVLLRAAPGLVPRIFGSASYSVSYSPSSPGYDLGATRVRSSVGGADEAGALLFVTLGFALLRHTLRLDRRRSSWLTIVTICMGIAATLTRTAIVAACVLLVLWTLQRQIRTVSAAALKTRVVLLLAAAGVVAVAFVGASALQSRLSDVNPSSSGSSFAQGRGLIWAHEVRALRLSTPAQLLTGRGLHTSYRIAGSPTQDDSPHNLWLWLLVELGVIGFVSYAFFLTSVFRTLRRSMRRHRFEMPGQAAAVGAVVVASYCIIDFFLLTPTSPANRWYFMLFLGAVLRASTGHWRAQESQ